MRPSAPKEIVLAGIAREQRPAFATRAGAVRGAAALSIAGAVLALSGCTPSDEGVVLEGADGQKYVVPVDAERPEYDSKEDCIADVTEQIALLEQQGEQISDDPEALCESADAYSGGHYSHPWIGPIIFAGSRWGSSRVAGWSPVSSGGFAAPGAARQADMVSPAPAGARVGDRTTISGGFGGNGKSGFGSSAGG